MSNFDPAAITTAILHILQAHPEGIKEYDLIKALQAQDHLPPYDASDQLALFRIHFIVFHLLYQLRNQLWASEQAHLEISTLCICLRPYAVAESGLSRHDSLAEYYLDLTHLESTTEDDVIALLNNFWEVYQAHEDRDRALAAIDLEPPVDYRTVRQRYRKLVREHHPDTGGESERFQEIQWAMDVLEVYYQKSVFGNKKDSRI